METIESDLEFLENRIKHLDELIEISGRRNKQLEYIRKAYQDLIYIIINKQDDKI